MTKNNPISIATVFSGRQLLFEFFWIDASNTEIYNEHDAFFRSKLEI